MKKVLMSVVCLILVLAVAASASAATYVSNSRLKRAIKNETSKHVIDLDLDSGTSYVIEYSNDDHSIYAVFSVQGNKGNIVAFSLLEFGEAYGENELEKALRACNKWNYEKRYPRLYLDMEDRTFAADGFLFCTDDVTDDMISQFVSNQLFGLKQLFGFLSDEGFDYFENMQ